MCVGVWTDFLEDGTKLKEAHYINNRTFKVLWFGLHGEITETEYMIDHRDVTKVEFERYAEGAEQSGLSPYGEERGHA